MISNIVELWWETMAGPQLLIRQMADALSAGKSVLLQISGRLPWQDQIRDILAQRFSTVPIEQAVLSPGEPHQLIPQLLGQLRRAKGNRCPQAYKAQLTYLREEQIFRESVIWIHPTPDCDLVPVIQLLSDFRGKGLAESGCFVLEVSDRLTLPRLSNAVAVLNCGDTIHFGDVRLFSSILTDMEPGLPEPFKRYTAQLAAQLAGKNGELVPVLLQYLRPGEEPAQSIAQIRRNMPADCGALPDQSTLGQLIWKAQLQTVFADIEMARIQITSDWAATIEAALRSEYWDPQKNRTGFVEQMGERPTSSADVELGTLVHMMSLRRKDNHSQYLLYIPDEQARDWIFFLRECRNKLAHHIPCSQEEMRKLLTGLSA